MAAPGSGPLGPSALQAPVLPALKRAGPDPLPSLPRPNILSSALLPCLPSPIHPLSGHKGPFLFAQPKEAGCQGDRSRNSRELAMGEGLCPQTAVSGSSPSWGRRACLSGGNTPREDTFLFAILPPAPVSTAYLPPGAASQPAIKNAPVYKTHCTQRSPLQCTGLSHKHKHACWTLPHLPLPHGRTVGWLGRRPAVTSA